MPTIDNTKCPKSQCCNSTLKVKYIFKDLVKSIDYIYCLKCRKIIWKAK